MSDEGEIKGFSGTFLGTKIKKSASLEYRLVAGVQKGCYKKFLVWNATKLLHSYKLDFSIVKYKFRVEVVV